MEEIARKAGGELLTHWRHLTASDHLYAIHQRTGRESSLGAYGNPLGESLASAVHILTRKIDILTVTIFRFEILTRKERPAVSSYRLKRGGCRRTWALLPISSPERAAARAR